MRIDPLLLAALASAAVAATAAAQQAASAPQLTAQSSYRVKPRTRNCTFGYQSVGTRYIVVGTGAFEGPPPHLVLEERTSVDQCENLEGPTAAEVSVVARRATNPSARPVWTIRQRGEQGAVDERYGNRAMYRITEFGCCGSEDLDTYYSLTDGHRLFTADHPLLTLDAQPFGTGVVAVHDGNAAGSPGAEGDRTLIAVVTFSPEKGPIQRLAVRGPSNDFALPTIELVARGPGGAVKHGDRLDIDADLDARWTVAVAIDLEGMADGSAKGRVEIPIAAGRLSPETARITGPFRVAALPTR